MTFLPVVGRELRVAARRRYTYWTRFLSALVALGLSAWVWGWLYDGQAEHERGLALFKAVSGLAFTYCLLVGIPVTSDSLSEEKREGTLGLLFLTDLKGYDVVLGKLAATSLNALYRLFAIFPILAIPLVLGGLTFQEVGRMALVLTNTLFFSLSAGMLASALSVRERQAMILTILIIIGTTSAPPLLGLLSAYRAQLAARQQLAFSPPGVQPIAYNQTWLWSSAVYPSVLALDRPYKANPKGFWSAVAVTQTLSWTFLALAGVIVRGVWQDRPAAGLAAQWRQRWSDWHFGAGAVRTALRRRLLEINPILWLNGRDRLRVVFVFALLVLIGLGWGGLAWKYPSSMFDPTVYFLTSYGLHTILKVWLASEASRPLAEDRRTGALELVLSTPLSVNELLEGQILGLKQHFLAPVLSVLAADMLMLAAGMRDRITDSPDGWLFLCLGVMAVFVADLYTLAWVGMWLGLTARKSSRALAGNLTRVLVLPWAIFLLGLSFLALVQWTGLNEMSEIGLITSAFVIALATDAFLLPWAQANLRTRFRIIATQRFDSRSALTLDPPRPAGNQPTPPPVLAH